MDVAHDGHAAKYEAKFVSSNLLGAPAKFDIRAWSPDHTKMGKGITLSNEEFQVMVDSFKCNK